MRQWVLWKLYFWRLSTSWWMYADNPSTVQGFAKFLVLDAWIRACFPFLSNKMCETVFSFTWLARNFRSTYILIDIFHLCIHSSIDRFIWFKSQIIIENCKTTFASPVFSGRCYYQRLKGEHIMGRFFSAIITHILSLPLMPVATEFHLTAHL